MVKKHLLGLIVPIVALATGVSSCSDYDNGLTEKDIQYAQSFKETFGEIDPNQDWNMAQQVNAAVNISNLKGSATIKIFEVDPLASVGAKYLTEKEIIDGKASWKFDAPDYDTELFVQVKQNEERLYAGYCTIVDGQLIIENGSFHKKSSHLATRDADTGLGAEKWTELCFEPTLNSDAVIVDDNNYLNHIKQIKIGVDGFVYYTSDIISKPFRKLAYNNDGGTGYYLDNNRDIHYADGEQEVAIAGFAMMNFVTYSGGKYQFKSDVIYAHKAHVAHAYAITANTETVNTKWLIGDCKDLFWEGDASFAEGVDYRNSKKTDVYAENGTSVAEIEKGVIFTTTKVDAEIDIPMMYGATDKHNILGYYYYTTDQDPRDVNRYILYDDARPSTNIKVDDEAVGGMTLQQKQSDWKDESVVSCVTRKLMYFGKNGEETGTTKFPKDVKIGFFIRRHADSYNTGAATLPGEGGWAFSDPTLNYQHIYDAKGPNLLYQGTNWTYRGSRSVSGINSDTGKGNVKAICWNYGGRVLVGFGDDTGDCDLNDFVFWVNGDVDDPSKVKIKVKDEEDIYEWMVACEDLGSTDDYDFNDVVFGVKHYTRVSNIHEAYYDNATGNFISTVPTVIEKKNYLVITPYAAGGSLKSNVWYNGSDLGEIHGLLRHDQKATYDAMESGSMPILNAAAGSPQYVGNPVVITLADDAEFTITNMSDFLVKTSQEGGNEDGEKITAPKEGTAPQMMVLPSGWCWPSERTQIDKVYPKFKDWANDMTENGWIETPQGSFVRNPYTTANAEGSGSGGSVTPGKASWELSIEGPNELVINSRGTATYTVTIEGVDDLSALTCGVDDGNWNISVSNTGGVITLTQGDNVSLGATKFWVSYPDDDTHKTTKLYFPLTIVAKNPDFTMAIGNESILNGGTYEITTATNEISNFTIAITDGKGDGNAFQITSSNTEIASITGTADFYNHNIKINGVGETTITVKHKAQGDWKEVTKTFTLKVSAPGTSGGDPVNVTPCTIFDGSVTVNGNNANASLQLNWPENTVGYTKLIVSVTTSGAAKIEIKGGWSTSASDEIDIAADATTVEVPLKSNGIATLKQQGAYAWNNSSNTYTITKIELR